MRRCSDGRFLVLLAHEVSVGNIGATSRLAKNLRGFLKLHLSPSCLVNSRSGLIPKPLLHQGGIKDANWVRTRQHRVHARSALQGHGLIHGSEKGVVVKGFNKIGDRPGLYRRFSHRVMVVRRTYDDTRVG
jgi:hypothetical protein